MHFDPRAAQPLASFASPCLCALVSLVSVWRIQVQNLGMFEILNSKIVKVKKHII